VEPLAELVMTVLFGSDAVREVVTGGQLPVKPGATWVDITTVSPAEADEFAAGHGDDDFAVIAAPELT
jgi:3-hydroxyisobutyrate dehydrogenase